MSRAQEFCSDQENYAPMSKSTSADTIHLSDGVQNDGNSSENRSIPSSPRVAPSNCAGCYRRKIKCDRQLDGCFNCSKGNIKCTYPRQDPTVRQKRGPYHKDPSKRKGGFEQKILALESRLMELSQKLQNGKEASLELAKHQLQSPRSPRERSSSGSLLLSGEQAGSPKENQRQARKVGGEFGVSLDSSIWADFVDKSDDPVTVRDGAMSGERTVPRSDMSMTADLLLNSGPGSSNIRHLHPPANTILEYWQVYKKRVDPVTKILHVPSFERKLSEAVENLEGLSAGMEAMMFSIYYAAVYSLSTSDFQNTPSESKESLLESFGYACKQAFSNVNILCSQDMVALQALTIFLISNHQDDFQLVYTLTGVALRMAQSLGLDQDGSEMALPPFEVEMRRRLWWNIYRLERRAVEDYNMNPLAIEQQFGTHLPTNLNDADISPEDVNLPKPKMGRTEMTYCLVDIEIALLTFAVRDKARTTGMEEYNGAKGIASLCDKQRMVKKCYQRLTSNHLQYCNNANDLDFMTLTSANLNMTRIWLSIHQPSPLHLQFALPHLYHPDKVSHRLLLLTLDTIDHVQRFQKDIRISPWAWNLSVATKLHLASFLLTELCYRPEGALGERAWKTVDEIFGGTESDDVLGEAKDLSSPFRDGLRKLFAQMMANRQKDLGSTRFPHLHIETSTERLRNPNPWDLELDRTASADVHKARYPHPLPQRPLSPPNGAQSANALDAFSPSNSNRTSQINLGTLSAGHNAIFGSSSTLFDHARDLSTWGFLTPNDSMDLLEGPYPFIENSTFAGASHDEFMGVEWDDALLQSMNLEMEQ